MRWFCQGPYGVRAHDMWRGVLLEDLLERAAGMIGANLLQGSLEPNLPFSQDDDA
jgi:hypothetical protein